MKNKGKEHSIRLPSFYTNSSTYSYVPWDKLNILSLPQFPYLWK
jgi:hypothetical protein